MITNPAEVQAQLERILASPIFSASARSVQFLRFCVEQSLQGNHDQIKESTVAVQVFGRAPSYDPRVDPIVRVHAKRLRDKLEHYYAVQGADDPIRILLPKGSYVPQAVKTLPKPKLDFSDWPASSLTEAADAAHPNPQRHTMFWAVGSAIVLLILIGAALLVERRAVPPPLFDAAGEPLPLNGAPGKERNPDWSPDGKLLAFSWDGGVRGSSKIYLQKVGQSQAYRLTPDFQAEYRPVWSPSSQEVAFIRYVDSGHFEVIRASLNGRSKRSERRVGTFSYYWPVLDDPPALDWSPDGRFLLVAEQPSAVSPVRLLLLTLATGERRPLTNPPSGTSGDIEGKFSPDGSLIAFHRGGFGDLYLIPVAGEAANPARALTTSNPGIRGIAWSRDGRHILFGSHRDGSGWGIWQVDVDGGTSTRVLSGGFDVTSPTLSPDGMALAVEHEDRVINLTEFPFDRRRPSRLFAPSSRQDYTPAYSPDGKQVVFISTRSGPMELWTANSDGKGMQQLTRLSGAGFPLTPGWSPDGRKVIFALREGGHTNLVVSNVRDGAMQQLTFGRDRSLNPVYSADGQYIYFTSNAGGAGRIWRMAADGSGRKEQMFWDVPGVFQESQDRKSIIFKDSDPELRIGKRDLATGSLENVFHSDKRLSAFEDLCVHDNTLYLMLSSVGAPSQSDLIAVDIESGKTRLLESLDQTSSGLESGCTVSPDGRVLLLTTVQRDDSDIYLVKLARR